MSDYATVLRTRGVDTVSVPRVYLTALTTIRTLVRQDLLSPADTLSEIEAVFDGLERVQEDLDSREA